MFHRGNSWRRPKGCQVDDLTSDASILSDGAVHAAGREWCGSEAGGGFGYQSSIPSPSVRVCLRWCPKTDEKWPRACAPPGGGQCGQWRTGLGPALRAKSTSRAGSPVDPPAQWVRGLKSRRAGKICRLQPAKMAAALTTQSCELPPPNPRPVHAQFTASRRQTAQPDPTALSRRDTSPAISSRPHPLGAMEPEQQPGYDASCATLPLLGRPERPNQASQGRRRRRGLAASQQLRPGCVRTCVYFLSPFSCISSRRPGRNARDWTPVESSRPESMTRLTRSRHAALEFPGISVAL